MEYYFPIVGKGTWECRSEWVWHAEVSMWLHRTPIGCMMQESWSSHYRTRLADSHA